MITFGIIFENNLKNRSANMLFTPLAMPQEQHIVNVAYIQPLISSYNKMAFNNYYLNYRP